MRYADLLDILYEDNHLLAIHKPAGWSSAHGDDDTMLEVAKSYIKEKYQKPGNVFLGVVHRIDKPVSGVLLFARTSKAAARLSEQFRNNGVEKTYWAIIETQKPSRGYGWALGDSATLEDYLWHDDSEHDVKVVDATFPGAKAAKLFYTVKAVQSQLALVELRPQSGRKHQLRVQLASRGCPIVGDTKYGSTQHFGNSIALHARSLTVLHPITSEPLTFIAEVPKTWRGRFAKLLNAS